jgi:hypothetical protein
MLRHKEIFTDIFERQIEDDNRYLYYLQLKEEREHKNFLQQHINKPKYKYKLLVKNGRTTKIKKAISEKFKKKSEKYRTSKNNETIF